MPKRKPSSLEARWLHIWSLFGERQALKAEYQFHPPRRWRFDFCMPELRIAIELEGGTWTGGRHTRGVGFEKDCEKYNVAAVDGWIVFRFTTSMLAKDPKGCVDQVLEVMRQMRTATAGIHQAILQLHPDGGTLQ